MNPGRQIKCDYSLAVLRKTLFKEEKDLEFWNRVQQTQESDLLAYYAVRQAKGNLSSTEQRIKDLKAAINLLDPPKEEVKNEK